MRFLYVLLLILCLYIPTDVYSSNDTTPIVQEICSYDWHCETAVKVAYRESNLIPSAVNSNCNPSRPYTMVCVGVFQIWTAHCPTCDLTDYKLNIFIAYKLYSESGWRPWGIVGP